METISPELVLVDPDLAGIERARLAQRARLEELIGLPRIERAATTRTEPQSADDPRRWLLEPLAAVLGLAIFAGGVWAAVVFAGGRTSQTSPAAHTATAASPTGTARPAHLRATATVEREVLALLTRAPGRELSAGLVDRTTGLAKNNLQVSCHRAKGAGVFACMIRSPADNPAERVNIRYQVDPNGDPVVTMRRPGRRTPGSRR